MKTTKFLAMVLPVSAAAMLAGCNDAAVEENIAPEVQNYEISATIMNEGSEGEEADDTRAYIDENFFTRWQKGDQITFFPCGDNNPTVGTLAPNYDDMTYGVFTLGGFSFTENETINHYGVFPHNTGNKLIEESQTLCPVMATEQVYKEKSYGGLNTFMTAYAPVIPNYSFTFQVYHGALGLKLKGNAKGFKIIVESKVEPLAGPVHIVTPYIENPGYPVAVGEVTNTAAKTVTFDCSNVQLTSEAKPFCVALLPGTYTKLRVRVVDLEGKEIFKGTVSKLKIRRNSMKMMAGEIEYSTIDHTKNPLLKWAETNLVYNKTSKKSSFATNGEKGSLYQWGRNAGFEDWKDARGTYNASTRLWNYGIGNCGTDYYHAGTGRYYVRGGVVGCPAPQGYDSQSVLKSNTDLWYMNVAGGDYWLWSGGGSNWGERATACGYPTETPCPSDEWRLPTVADFKEIMPSTEINTSSSLSSALNNKVELKEIPGVCKYAIKWTKTTAGITIKALVVADDFANADLSTIKWDSDENVVTRIFPFTGAIRSTAVQTFPTAYPSTGYYDFQEDKIASPMPLGEILVNSYTDQYSVNNGSYTIIYDIYWTTWYSGIDNSQLYGAYWVSDAKETFTFVENSGWYVLGNESQTSQFRMKPQDAHNGYAIRCVKNETK